MTKPAVVPKSKPLNTPTTVMGAIRQMRDTFAAYRLEPEYAKWRACRDMALAAAVMPTEPYLFFKAASLAAQCSLNPLDRKQSWPMLQRAKWAEMMLRKAYACPVSDRIFTPSAEHAFGDMANLKRIAAASGSRTIHMYMHGVAARHFNTGEDPIAAEQLSLAAERERSQVVQAERAAARLEAEKKTLGAPQPPLREAKITVHTRRGTRTLRR